MRNIIKPVENMRCIIYVRASEPEADRKAEWQHRSLRQFAKEHRWRIVGAFTDVSVRNDDDRPGLSAAVQAAVDAQVGALVVTSLEHLRSSMRALIDLEEDLQAADVALVSAQALSVPPIELNDI